MEKFILRTEKGIDEYIIFVEKDGEYRKYTLKTTENAIWNPHMHNVELIVLIDNGDGFYIEKIGKKSLKKDTVLDYSSFSELNTMFSFIKLYDKQCGIPYDVVKYESLGTI